MKITFNKIKKYYINHWTYNLFILSIVSLTIFGVYLFQTDNSVYNLFWRTSRPLNFKVINVEEKGNDFYLKLAFIKNKEGLNDSIIYKKVSYIESLSFTKDMIITYNISYKKLNDEFICKKLLNKMKPSYTDMQKILIGLTVVLCIICLFILIIYTIDDEDIDLHSLLKICYSIIIPVALFLGSICVRN